jgi:electron transfer flavoprotein beta subunit
VHIAAVLRLVPDLSADIEIADGGKDVDREWVDLKLNEFDDQALEEAILLKEGTGAKVTALALDGEGVDRMLQTALARGADQALKISHDLAGVISSRAAAPLLAAAARQIGVDLIVTGVQAPDDLLGQLAPYLGSELHWPHLSAVSSIRTDADTIVVQQEFGGSVAGTLRVRLPAVVGVQTASQPIRYVSGTKLRQATALSIPSISTDAEAGDPRAEVAALTLPDRNGGATMLEGDAKAVADQLARLLIDRKLVKG